MAFDSKTLAIIKQFQENEITECHIYKNLARKEKNKNNQKILEEIGEDEHKHYDIWKQYSKTDVSPNRTKIFYYYWLAQLLGLTFSLKLMENMENKAQQSYSDHLIDVPEIQMIIKEENIHEHNLIGLIREDLLTYVGSIVLGLNDALIELTGVLAGLSFALQNTRLIGIAGLITGIAAAFSMAASEYLSQKEEHGNNPVSSAIYTGLTYIVTVILLIMPYLFFANYLICLGITLSLALLIIMAFTFYISVAKDLPFRRRFTEMAVISLGVAAITFIIGVLVKKYIGVSV